jgi:chromosome segregation ATPase
MDNKEQLQAIKRHISEIREIYGDIKVIPYPTAWIDWLIGQVEKAEQLETDKEFFKKEYMQINEKYLRVLEQLKQAQEKIEQQQQEIERLNELYLDREKSLLETISVCENFDEQLQQAQAKAERYKNHLLCIQRHYGLPSEPTDFVPVTVLHEIQMIVSNALEEVE